MIAFTVILGDCAVGVVTPAVVVPVAFVLWSVAVAVLANAPWPAAAAAQAVSAKRTARLTLILKLFIAL